ncbi:recombinase family protein [Nostocoides vanveenii]|uniref:Recombinase family protein n=1 Tax=Nostocoides vanveenii TaxID=330835 RepID=A0ABN2L2X4_9MICO
MKAAIYVRISKDSEKKGLGVDRQRKDCLALAERLGWEIVETIVENDQKASDGALRPKYQRMLGMAATRQIEAIIGWDLDRVTRTPSEAEELFEYAKAMGLQLKSHNGDLDLITPQGKLTTRVRTAVSAFEIEQIQARLRSETLQRAQSGRYNGPRPFGYDFATDDHGRILTGSRQELVICEPEAEAIREAVSRVLDGEALWSITKDFNQRGIATTTGGQWHTQTLRRMLMRWTHAGYRKHQRYEKGRFVGKESLYEAAWPAIIDRDTHERVLALLTDPTRRKSRSTEAKYLLTSIALCGACGRYLVGTTSYEYTIKGTYVRKDGTRSPDKVRMYPETYKCPHAGCHAVTRRMDAVDELVEATVVAFLEREGVEAFGGDPAAVVAAQARFEAIEAKLALLTDQWVGDKITDAQYERGTALLRPELESEKARLRQALPVDGLREFTGTGAGAAWKRADVVTKKRVLRALGDMVGLTITIAPVGAGASSRLDADRYAGIRIETVGRDAGQ